MIVSAREIFDPPSSISMPDIAALAETRWRRLRVTALRR
jgi:hypothetical protein